MDKESEETGPILRSIRVSVADEEALPSLLSRKLDKSLAARQMLIVARIYSTRVGEFQCMVRNVRSNILVNESIMSTGKCAKSPLNIPIVFTDLIL